MRKVEVVLSVEHRIAERIMREGERAGSMVKIFQVRKRTGTIKTVNFEIVLSDIVDTGWTDVEVIKE